MAAEVDCTQARRHNKTNDGNGDNIHLVASLRASLGNALLFLLLQLSIAVIYKGEDLAQACGDGRRVSYKVFRRKIDDISVKAFSICPDAAFLRLLLLTFLPQSSSCRALASSVVAKPPKLSA